MWSLLSLPDKFLIKKKQDTKSFLAKANLSPAQKDELTQLVSSVELKYDIRFVDKSEIILIEVGIKYQKDKWTAKDVARIVAQSIPYDCIVYVHDNTVRCFSVFARQENSLNCGRSTILRQSVIPEFDFEHIPDTVSECLADIGQILSDEKNNAVSASTLCMQRIDECKKNYPRDRLIDEEILKERADIRRILRLLQQGFDSDPNDNRIRKNYDNYDISMSEEALCKSAYAFFCDFECSTDIILDDVPEWLLIYAINCINVLDDIFNIEPDSYFFYQLGASFCKQNVTDIDYYMDDPAVQLMIETINEGDFYV